jgi:hypothetical protein
LRAFFAQIGASSLSRRLYKGTVFAITEAEFTGWFGLEMTSCLLVPTEITRALVPAFVSSSSVLNITLPERLFLGRDHDLHFGCARLFCAGVIGVIGQGADDSVGLV